MMRSFLFGRRHLGRFRQTLGISVHPEFNYIVVKVEEEKFLIAEDLLAIVAEEIGWEDYDS